MPLHTSAPVPPRTTARQDGPTRDMSERLIYARLLGVELRAVFHRDRVPCGGLVGTALGQSERTLVAHLENAGVDGGRAGIRLVVVRDDKRAVAVLVEGGGGVGEKFVILKRVTTFHVECNHGAVCDDFRHRYILSSRRADTQPRAQRPEDTAGYDVPHPFHVSRDAHFSCFRSSTQNGLFHSRGSPVCVFLSLTFKILLSQWR